MSEPPLSPETLCVSLGRPPAEPGEPVNAPVVLTSTYRTGGRLLYARESNPTWEPFEEAVGALEGGRALVLASGMAAVDAALSLVPVGGIVVAPASAYSGVVATLGDRVDQGRVVLREVDLTETAEVIAALDGAALIWLESPSNPLLEVSDLPTLITEARARGVLTVVDNTFSTPLLARPLAWGADVVVHSATKYLSGHSDVLLGLVVTRSEDLFARIRRHRQLGGAIAGPMETYLALRGLRTLAVRLERAAATASVLAQRLEGHPAIERVRYPGFGAMLSIEVRGGAEAADAVCAATAVWVPSTSLGGVESQLERRRVHTLEPVVVPENLVRLSVGVEHVEDLWRDLDQALDAAAALSARTGGAG